MAFGLHGARRLTGTVGTSSTPIAHGLPFIPAVYAVVVKAASAVAVSVVSVDATNVNLIAGSANTPVDVFVGAPPA